MWDYIDYSLDNIYYLAAFTNFLIFHDDRLSFCITDYPCDNYIIIRNQE